MTFEAPNHALSKASRVNALLMCAIQKTSVAVPCFADGWKLYQQLNAGDMGGTNDSGDELNLLKTLFPVLSLARTVENIEVNNGSTTHLCLFSELLLNCMYGEAMECCYLISSIADAFSEPNCRERMGVHLLRGFELRGADQVSGVLGLDHINKSILINTCVSAAISVAMKLNYGLDGNTHVPLPMSDGSGDSLRVARSKMGLPTTLIENWPEMHHGRLQK